MAAAEGRHGILLAAEDIAPRGGNMLLLQQPLGEILLRMIRMLAQLSRLVLMACFTNSTRSPRRQADKVVHPIQHLIFYAQLQARLDQCLRRKLQVLKALEQIILFIGLLQRPLRALHGKGDIALLLDLMVNPCA